MPSTVPVPASNMPVWGRMTAPRTGRGMMSPAMTRPSGAWPKDWMRMMNRGVFKAAVANSDTHGLYHAEAGMPRNFVAYGSDIPRHVRPDDLDQAVRERRVVGSSGPFIRFTVNDEGVGGTVMSPPDGRVTLKIEVQSPTWFDVDRVQVFRNGELLKASTPARKKAVNALSNRTSRS